MDLQNIMQANQVVLSIRDKLITTLDGVLGYGSASIFNWCNYNNPGDHMIAFATSKYLYDSGVSIDSVQTGSPFDAVDSDVIISQGGGNLGDLYLHIERQRRCVIQRFVSKPIVIMPQSVYFYSDVEAAKSADIYNAHTNLTILVREAVSYRIASDLFNKCRVILCPDSAWYLADWVMGIVSRYRSVLDDNMDWHDLVFRFKDYDARSVLSLAVVLGAMMQLSRCDHLVTRGCMVI